MFSIKWLRYGTTSPLSIQNSVAIYLGKNLEFKQFFNFNTVESNLAIFSSKHNSHLSSSVPEKPNDCAKTPLKLALPQKL